MIFCYSNLKENDLTQLKTIIMLQRHEVTHYIIDFQITSDEIPNLLKLGGIVPFYRMKLYSKPWQDEIDQFIKTCYTYGCVPAFDCEPYDKQNSPWTDDSYSPIIPAYAAVYPEPAMSDPAYCNYSEWVGMLGPSYVIHELTYHKYMPWDMIRYKRENSVPNTINVFGLWLNNINKPMWIKRIILTYAKWLYGNIMIYTETKELL